MGAGKALVVVLLLHVRYSLGLNPVDVYLLASGALILVRPTAPYYYEDAVKEKVVHEVLVPEMLEYWFRNREDGGAFLNARQA